VPHAINQDGMCAKNNNIYMWREQAFSYSKMQLQVFSLSSKSHIEMP